MFPFDMGGGFGLFFLFSFALSIAVTIGLIVLIGLGIRWLIRNTGSGPGAASSSQGPTEDTALATLRERFARGEIDADEYEQRRRTLGA
jgi:putative membrane protein